jgi:hypothetical protein
MKRGFTLDEFTCRGRKKATLEEFIEKAHRVHGNIYGYDKFIYKGYNIKGLIYCKKCKNYFKQTPHNHVNDHGCPNCAKNQLSNTKEFIEKAREVHRNIYDYSEVDYNNNRIKIKIFCKKCQKHFWQTPTNHLRGNGCLDCAIKNRSLSTKTFIEKAQKKHGNIYDYLKVDYKNSNTAVIITCPKHGPFPQTPNSHLRGHGCPVCNQSKKEEFTKLVLTNHGIDFEPQYRFKDCKDILPLPFDVYIPKLDTLIEYQGRQHRESVDHFGGEVAFRKQQRHDQIKRDYCKRKKIKLIAIPDTEDTYEKIEKYLIKRLKIA